MQYNMQYMGKFTIYAPAMKLKLIDLYCQEKKIARSTFLINCAISFINATKGNIRCDFCTRPTQGKYKLTIYDMATGEREEIKNLCSYHYEKAKKEGVGITEAEN